MHRNETPEDLMIKNILESSEKSANHSLSVLMDTKKIGTETLKALDAQGRQIHDTQADMDHVLYENKVAKKSLRTISNLFWALYYKIFPRVPYVNNNKNAHNKVYPKTTTSTVGAALSGDVIGDALNGGVHANQYQKTEAMLDEMGAHVKDLNVIASDMGAEINDHNERLDVLIDTAGEANANSHDLNKRTNKALRRFS
tara:strand:+ start:1347 stop:1943 length:597 start_codon:yes stop_codon:yes gene_type:complete